MGSCRGGGANAEVEEMVGNTADAAAMLIIFAHMYDVSFIF